jgi:hypothetical protein
MKNTLFDKWKKLALSLAILIVMNIFFNVGIDTFYEMPDEDAFCGEVVKDVEYAGSQETCLENGGTWNIGQDWEYCEEDGCWEDWREALAPYNRNAFIILVVLGTVTLLVGMFVAMPMAVGNGLLYGGILSIVIGTMRYWPDMDDYLRFIVSGVVLAILVLVGIKKVKD